MRDNNPISVAIVGGGIGGLSLGVGLLQHPHIDLSIYEAAPAFAEIGAGLALGPNAQRALQLISPAVAQGFTNHATANTSAAFQNTWFEFRHGLAGEEDGAMLGRVENDTGQQTVHRAKFLNELARLIPNKVARFNKQLVHLKELTSGKIEMTFADGSIATTDCVIGAGGVHSTVRKYVCGNAKDDLVARFSVIVAYRGLVAMDVVRRNIGHYADDSYIWTGPGGMVMTYPIDYGQTLNVVAARYGVKEWKHPKYAVQVEPEAMKNDYADWGRILTKVLEMIEQPTLWAMLEHPAAPRYHCKNAVIMGDAAHATTPFQGAGAGQAIEDALVLTKLFEHVRNTTEVAPALAAFSAVRKERSQRVVVTSRAAIEHYGFQNRIVNGNSESWKALWKDRMK